MGLLFRQKMRLGGASGARRITWRERSARPTPAEPRGSVLWRATELAGSSDASSDPTGRLTQRLECLPYTEEVGGSNPSSPTTADFSRARHVGARRTDDPDSSERRTAVDGRGRVRHVARLRLAARTRSRELDRRPPISRLRRSKPASNGSHSNAATRARHGESSSPILARNGARASTNRSRDVERSERSSTFTALRALLARKLLLAEDRVRTRL